LVRFLLKAVAADIRELCIMLRSIALSVLFMREQTCAEGFESLWTAAVTFIFDVLFAHSFLYFKARVNDRPVGNPGHQKDAQVMDYFMVCKKLKNLYRRMRKI